MGCPGSFRPWLPDDTSLGVIIDAPYSDAELRALPLLRSLNSQERVWVAYWSKRLREGADADVLLVQMYALTEHGKVGT